MAPHIEGVFAIGENGNPEIKKLSPDKLEDRIPLSRRRDLFDLGRRFSPLPLTNYGPLEIHYYNTGLEIAHVVYEACRLETLLETEVISAQLAYKYEQESGQKGPYKSRVEEILNTQKELRKGFYKLVATIEVYPELTDLLNKTKEDLIKKLNRVEEKIRIVQNYKSQFCKECSSL